MFQTLSDMMPNYQTQQPIASIAMGAASSSIGPAQTDPMSLGNLMSSYQSPQTQGQTPSPFSFQKTQDPNFGTKVTSQQPANFLNTSQMNNLGTMNLTDKFDSIFSPNFRSQPQAQGMIGNLNNLLTQKFDAGQLQKLVESSKHVTDYFSQNKLFPIGKAGERVAG